MGPQCYCALARADYLYSTIDFSADWDYTARRPDVLDWLGPSS